METAATVLTDATSKAELVEETPEIVLEEEADDSESTSTFHIESQLEHLENLLNQAESEVASTKQFDRTHLDGLITNVDSGDFTEIMDGTTPTNILGHSTTDNILELLGFSDDIKPKKKEYTWNYQETVDPAPVLEQDEKKEGENEDPSVVTESSVAPLSETDEEKNLGTEGEVEEDCPNVLEQKEGDATVDEDKDEPVAETETAASNSFGEKVLVTESGINVDCVNTHEQNEEGAVETPKEKSEAVVDANAFEEKVLVTESGINVDCVDADAHEQNEEGAVETPEKKSEAVVDANVHIMEDAAEAKCKKKVSFMVEEDEEISDDDDEELSDDYEDEELSDDEEDEVVTEEHDIPRADSDQNTPGIEVSETGVKENFSDAEVDEDEDKPSNVDEDTNKEIEEREDKEEEQAANEEITAEEYDKLWRNENSPDTDMPKNGIDETPTDEGTNDNKSPIVDGDAEEETDDSASTQKKEDATEEDKEDLLLEVAEGSDGSPKEVIEISIPEQGKESATSADEASLPTTVIDNVSLQPSDVDEDQEIVAAASDSILCKSGRYLTELKNEVKKLRSDYDRVQANNKRLSQANTSAGASFESLNQHAQTLQKKLEQSQIELKEANAALTESKTVAAELRDELAMKKASYVAEVQSRLSYQKTLQEMADLVQSECKDSAFVEKILALADKTDSEAMAVPALKPTDESNSVAESTCATEDTPTVNNKSTTGQDQTGYMSFIKACVWTT